MRMKSALMAAGAMTVGVLSACAGTSETSTEPTTLDADVIERQVVASPEGGRQPGSDVQKRLLVDAVNDMYESNGQPPVSDQEAFGLAESMCNFLDAGASTYDAKQVLDEEGYPDDHTAQIVAYGIAGFCNEHRP